MWNEAYTESENAVDVSTIYIGVLRFDVHGENIMNTGYLSETLTDEYQGDVRSKFNVETRPTHLELNFKINHKSQDRYSPTDEQTRLLRGSDIVSNFRCVVVDVP